MPSFSTSIIYLAKNIAKPKVIWEKEMQEIVQNPSTDVTETRNSSMFKPCCSFLNIKILFILK